MKPRYAVSQMSLLDLCYLISSLEGWAILGVRITYNFAHLASWQTPIEKADLFHDITSRPLPLTQVPIILRFTYRPPSVAQQNNSKSEAFIRPPSTQASVCFLWKGQGHFTRDCPLRTTQNDNAGN